jgi:hypothetical protein
MEKKPKQKREDMYREGYIYLRKRLVARRGKLYTEAPMWAIGISTKFGSWKLSEKFDTEAEAEADLCIEEFKGLYDKVIVE